MYILYIKKLFLWIWCFNIKKCSWISYFKNIVDLFCLIFFYVSNIHHMQFFINSIFVQDSCASVGGWLVAIESKSENMFIKSRLNHEFGKYWFFLHQQKISSISAEHWFLLLYIQTRSKNLPYLVLSSYKYKHSSFSSLKVDFHFNWYTIGTCIERLNVNYCI